MRQSIWLPGKDFPIFIEQQNREQTKPVIRLRARTDVITGGRKWIGEIVGNFHNLQFQKMSNKIHNDDVGTLYFPFAKHITIYIRYEFEDYAHYHDRTGKGHPDAAMREIMHHKKIRPDAT